MSIQSIAVYPGGTFLRDRSRERAADFEDFVSANADVLMRAAVLMCRDPQLAEDLTQTTLTKLFVAWDRVRLADSPIAYARTVLLRTYLSHRRRRYTTERPMAQLPESAIGPPDPSRLDLLDALQQLEPLDRAVIVLRYWEDVSVADTAQLLGMRESTCRSRTRRALIKLRERFPELDD